MRGFTVLEVVAAMTLLLAITAGVFAVVQSSPETALVHSEASDMQQRMRVAIDAILHDAIEATGVKPRRWGGPSEDPPGTFRNDTIALAGASGTTTYWLKAVAATDTFQLMRWGGGTSADVPVVDHVVALRFEYLADGGVAILDPELAGLRAIAVTVRVEAAIASLRGPAGALFARAGSAANARRWAPDLQSVVRVAPRNLNLER